MSAGSEHGSPFAHTRDLHLAVFLITDVRRQLLHIRFRRKRRANVMGPVTLDELLFPPNSDDEITFRDGDAEMSSGDEVDDRPISPPPCAGRPVARLEQVPLLTCNQSVGRSLSHLVRAQVRCISCISPHEFYVRVRENEQRFAAMQKQIDEMGHFFSHHPTNMQHGDSIAVYSFEFKSWCRAEFRCYNPPVERPVRARASLLSKAKNITVTALLIDYGFVDHQIFLFNVKGPFSDGPFDKQKYPLLHERCSLSKISPFPDTKKWSDAAIELTKRLIAGNMITVVVKKIEMETGVKLVDVMYMEATGKHAADLSLALHMADYARVAPTCDLDAMMQAPENGPKFRNAPIPQKGKVFSAIVDHIDSPDKFYLTWASKEKEVMDLQEEINLMYDRQDIREKYRVSVPLRHMSVIAVYSADKCYYRAEIRAVDLVERKVNVQFVDYGNQESVSLDNIFHVNERFMGIPKLANVCSMSDVKPYNTHDWSEHATTCFKQLVEENMTTSHLSVRIQGHSEGRLHVVLSKWVPGSASATSIGEVMVNMTCARRLRLDEDEGDVYETFKNEAIDSYRILTEINDRRAKAEMEIRDRLIEVQAYHVNSPSDMYIQLADPKIKEIFGQLNGRLNSFMTRGAADIAAMNAEINAFEVGDWCAIFARSGGINTWLRGKVSDRRMIAGDLKASGSQYEYDVIAVDAGYPFKNMRSTEVFQLPVEFQRHHPYAIRVALADISPAGGAEWLQTSTKKVIEFITNDDYRNNMYVLLNTTPPAERPETPLPVTLVAVKTEITGALMPEKMTYYVLNDLMIGEWGVAIGVRRPRGHLYDTDILNRADEPTTTPRISRGAVNMPFDENTLIARMQSMRVEVPSDIMYVYDECPPPATNEFQGLVTHIDDHMRIYFQLSDGIYRNSIHIVNRKIVALMADEPLPVMDGRYEVNRACTALFSFDNTWNRAKIMGLAPNKRSHIRVCFVDYGQVEDVVAENISSAVVCRNIPQLALRASLFQAEYTREKYAATQEELRTFLVDKICHFKAEDQFEGRTMKVTVKRAIDPEDTDAEIADDDGFVDVRLWLVNKDLIRDTSNPL